MPMAIDRDYLVGIAGSLGVHLLLLLLASGFLLTHVDVLPPTVYSVTLEGGTSLGGMAQTPKSNEKSPVAPPKKVTQEEPSLPKTKERESKKVQHEEKEQDTVALPRKTTTTPKKVAEEKKAPPKESESLAEINKALQKATQRYLGESSAGGGKGFGAAALGGKGMGGGVVRPPEFFTYKNLLEQRIRQGWRWFDRDSSLTAQVSFKITPEGRILDADILRGSGNSGFDDSVIRALEKASPVPPPPQSVYEYFREVRMTFDPREL